MSCRQPSATAAAAVASRGSRRGTQARLRATLADSLLPQVRPGNVLEVNGRLMQVLKYQHTQGAGRQLGNVQVQRAPWALVPGGAAAGCAWQGSLGRGIFPGTALLPSTSWGAKEEETSLINCSKRVTHVPAAPASQLATAVTWSAG